MALPFGNHVTIKPEAGHADSAPTRPRLKAKIIITSIISILLSALLVKLINEGYISKLIDSYMHFLGRYTH